METLPHWRNFIPQNYYNTKIAAGLSKILSHENGYTVVINLFTLHVAPF